MDIYNQITEKIIKSAAWVDRASLLQYILGSVAILSLDLCKFTAQEISNFIMPHSPISNAKIT